MKNRLFRIFIAALVLCFTASLLAGCGNNPGKKEDHAGYYVLTKMDNGTNALDQNTLNQAGLGSAYLLLKTDNTGILSLGEDSKIDLTWAPGAIVAKDISSTYTLKGDELTFTMKQEDAAVTMTFKRAGDALPPDPNEVNRIEYAGMYACIGVDAAGSGEMTPIEEVDNLYETWVELYEDSTFMMMFDGASNEEPYVYTLEGNKMTLDWEDGEMLLEATFQEDGTFSFEVDGVVYYFAK